MTPVSGIPASRNRELVEEGFDIEIGLTRRYANSTRETARKLGRPDIVEALDVLVDQVDDISDAFHHRQIPLQRAAS